MSAMATGVGSGGLCGFSFPRLTYLTWSLLITPQSREGFGIFFFFFFCLESLIDPVVTAELLSKIKHVLCVSLISLSEMVQTVC